MRRITAVCICLLLLACGCSKTGGTAGSAANPNAVLRVANYAEPTSLNPILATNTAENFLASLAFDLLVTIDDKGNDAADLAAQVPTLANGGISKDGLTITYHLRRNVKWQDGAAFTSADVKFTWQAIMNPNNNVVERRGYDQVRSIDTPDAYTVVFHLKQPFAPFVDTVFGESDDPFRIIPKHLLGQYPNLNKVAFNSLPIGTGPFRIVRWIHGDHVELLANPNYFRGKPRLAGINVYYVPDESTRVAELRSHQTDLIIDLGPAPYAQLQGVSGVKTILVKAPAYDSIDYNLTHPPLDDLRVRQALSYAIDEAGIVRDVEHGTARIATSDLSDFYWAYDPNVEGYPYDPQKAAQLLDQAGWKLGRGGIREKNGQPLSLQLVYGQGSEAAREIGVIVQSDLRKIGVDVPIKTYTYQMLYATKAEGGILSLGKFDLALWAWVAGADPDDSSQWMCAMAPPAGNNYPRYCNAQLDALERQALSTFDRGRRKAAYAKTQAILVHDSPAAFMFYQRLRYAMNPALQNFTPNGPSEGWNASDWSL
ncbi:MAG TPA: ABC transporter substrate-binding protein [Candidatus Baltobacteraceae bacterium]|nr:ABC transporter substrate-binding protein [Candidatus Baltobacteraceae bacterium]